MQRLGVLLQHDALVPRRALAAADGVQPAQGVRAAVRRRRHARGARRDREPDAEPARSHHAAAPARCSSDLGAGDRAVLDNYLETVREIERRVQLASSRDLSAIEVPEAPIGELDAFDEQVDLLFDLIALAYQADLTRVASYIMVAEGHEPHLQPHRRVGLLPSGLAPRQRPGPAREAGEDPDLARGALRRVRQEARRRSRTATARCWITRCSCTARTCPTATGTTATRCRRSSSAAATAALKGGQHIDPRAADAARQRAPDDPRQGRHRAGSRSATAPG